MFTAASWLVASLALIGRQPHLVAAATSNSNDGPMNLCGTFDNYNSTTVPFSFNNNAWGNDSTGFQCLTLDNGGTSFSVTYKWTGTPTLVKSYPYMKAHPSNLPVQLKNIQALEFSGQWNTYVQSAQNDSAAEQTAALWDVYVHSNVAIDMFLSDDPLNSTEVGSPIEIMIWPWWCQGMIPLGGTEIPPDKYVAEVAGTNFSLYHGWNAAGQHVFSWLAHQNLTSTHADYSPLLSYIWQNGLLSGDLWLGQLEFGSEIMHAGDTTVFEASNYTLRIVRDGEEVDQSFKPPVNTTTATNGTANATASSSTSVVSASGTGGAAASASSTRSMSSGRVDLSLHLQVWTFVVAGFVVPLGLAGYVLG